MMRNFRNPLHAIGNGYLYTFTWHLDLYILKIGYICVGKIHYQTEEPGPIFKDHKGVQLPTS